MAKDRLLFCSRTESSFGRRTSCDVRCIRFWPKRNQPQCGAHAFRRFRTTWLRKNGVPKDLEHFWLGHADEEVGDIYSKLKDDVAFRQEVTRRIGYGFELLVKERVVGPNGPKIKAESVQEVAVTV